MKAKAIHVCGTGSGVGKSVVVSALCRIFTQDGFRVAPFKSQNMALNSYVTADGGEMARAQVVQAQACGIEPTVDMNPILIKPSSDTGAQIIVRGKPIGNMNVLDYVKYKKNGIGIAKGSLDKLLSEYEIVVMEGAGSPSEINLKKHDIVNIKMAAYAKAPVILVGDIDRGGVFAWIVGTLELLTQEERKMVKGIIINKFRGDITLLKPGIKFLERYTGIKVLGVIPYFKDIKIPEEDAVPAGSDGKGVNSMRKINISVIYLPHISNFTDFDALERESDVALKYAKKPRELDGADIIIIPGTKNTISDLTYLRKSGFDKKITSIIKSNNKVMLIGICGGYQILGNKIKDLRNIESNVKEAKGLGFLPVETTLEKEKILARVKAKSLFLNAEVSGYEIHHGISKPAKEFKRAFEIFQSNGKEKNRFDGVISKDKRIFGTYIHGLFESVSFRRSLLNIIRKRKGWQALPQDETFDLDEEFDKLARLVRESLDTKSLYRILRG